MRPPPLLTGASGPGLTFPGIGGSDRIRTDDLRVMGPPSYRTAPRCCTEHMQAHAPTLVFYSLISVPCKWGTPTPTFPGVGR